MRLKKLVLQGFKSFKNKTTVHFQDGVTGIVGPNGCGKSNIVDALFWVMGEQSAKHLRGLSMKDLIFSGSSKYGPGAFAEVSLLLDNEEGKHVHIHKKVLTAPREIQVSRKLYRNGDSEYRINGLPARLRDVQEIFMDTGAGAKSYSIIAQGEIDRLVQAKPEERRAMIEEVAGITKFKLRRRESCRKIEQTQVNLGRIKDLQAEIYKNMKSLRKQAERAEKARSLRQKIERADLMVNSHKEYDLLNNFKTFSQFVQEKKFEMVELETRKQSLEADLEKNILRKVELSDEREAKQREFNDKSRRLAGDEEKLNYMRASQGEKVSLMEMKLKENMVILEENEEKKEFIRGLDKQHQALENLESNPEVYFAESSKIEQLKDELESEEKSLNDLKVALKREKEREFEAEKELFRVSSQMSELASRVENISSEIEAIERQHSGFSGELSDERNKVNLARSEVGECQKKLEQLVSDYWDSFDIKKRLNEEIDRWNRDSLKGEARLQSLGELVQEQKNKDIVPKEIVQHFPQLCSLFSEAISCKREEDFPAVKAILRVRAHALILREGKPDAIFEWLSQCDLGADLLLPSQHAASFDSMGMVPLVERVSLRDEKVLPLLQGVYIVDAIDSDLLDRVQGQRFSLIVSRDGRVVVENLGGTFRVRTFSLDANDPLVSDQVMEQLRDRMEELRVKLEAKCSELAQINDRIKKITQLKESTQGELSLKKVEYASLNSALNTKLSSLDSGEVRIAVFQERMEELSQERINFLQKKEIIQNERDDLQVVVDEKKSLEQDVVERVHRLRVEYNELREGFLIKKVGYETREDRIESLVDQIENQKIQLERNLKKLAENNEMISQYEKELGTIEKNIQELGKHNADHAFQLSRDEAILNDIKDELSNLLLDMQKWEDEIKKISASMSRSEKDIAVKEAKIEQIIGDEDQVQRNIFEKYHVDLRFELVPELGLSPDHLAQLSDVSDSCYMDQINQESGAVERVKIERKEYKFNRKYGQSLIEQKEKLKKYKQALRSIGEINWQSVDDYEKQKSRHQFLKQQQEELQTSISDLQEAISRIDEKSREKFKQAFNDVNIRFEKVFPLIFGGGSSRLKLVGEVDDPECGIDIIAQPPGKKMQNVNLMSGGEKAMTAVSLIFSIFLVKPSPFCLLDEVDAPLDDINVGRFNELLAEMSNQSQFILITHNKRTMEFNDSLYGITMQEPGISTAVSVQLQ